MHTTKKSWQNVLYIGILLAGICLLFYWYSTTNSQRIEDQNLNYAMDSARQTTLRMFGRSLAVTQKKRWASSASTAVRRITCVYSTCRTVNMCWSRLFPRT